MASFDLFLDASAEPHVRGLLHPSGGVAHSGLVLTHGAGSDSRAPLLVAIAESFANASFTVLRCDLPFRQRSPSGPPGRGDAKLDQAGLQNAVAALRAMIQGPIFLGGHSYGGRQASILAANNPNLAAGLLLLSYPLHPPGKPDQLRTQHFSSLVTPSLFVHGTRDGFGSVAEMTTALQMVNAKTELLVIEGAGHDLGAGKKSRQTAELVIAKFQAAMSRAV